jgi:hypothetical protein
MHWTMADLEALDPDVYTVLVEELTKPSESEPAIEQ